MAGKDTGEVDNNYFLVPVKILDHDGPLITEFPIENRLVPQGEPISAPSPASGHRVVWESMRNVRAVRLRLCNAAIKLCRP